jgi:hypothetical protein
VCKIIEKLSARLEKWMDKINKENNEICNKNKDDLEKYIENVRGDHEVKNPFRFM